MTGGERVRGSAAATVRTVGRARREARRGLFVTWLPIAGTLFWLGAWAAATSTAAQTATETPVAVDRAQLTVETESGRHTYSVEVARTPAQQARGLMFRDSMPADGGMLFIFEPERVVSMWMKNTFLSLDMLFVDSAGRILHIAERTEPMSRARITAGQPVRAVVELNAGTARAIGARPGDRITSPALLR